MPTPSHDRFTDINYEVRGPVVERAARLEAEGHRILKLHNGNPAAFGFEAPDEIVQEVIRQLPRAHGYSEAQGILPAREAVVRHYRRRGFEGLAVEDVYLGNGVSELIVMALQAMLGAGEEVLVPPPSRRARSLAGGDGASWSGRKEMIFGCITTGQGQIRDGILFSGATETSPSDENVLLVVQKMRGPRHGDGKYQ